MILIAEKTGGFSSLLVVVVCVMLFAAF